MDAEGQEVSREEEIAALVAMGMPEEFARFVVAVSRRETTGDVVEVDEDDNEVGAEGEERE